MLIEKAYQVLDINAETAFYDAYKVIPSRIEESGFSLKVIDHLFKDENIKFLYGSLDKKNKNNLNKIVEDSDFLEAIDDSNYDYLFFRKTIDSEYDLFIKVYKYHQEVSIFCCHIYLNKIQDFFKQIQAFKVKESEAKIGVLYQSEMGIRVKELPLPQQELDVELNYGKSFLKIHNQIIDKLENKIGGIYLYFGGAGTGKCLGKGTQILMYDGTLKNIENIKAGELIMGPDSNSKKVISTNSGSEELYRIIPVKGDSFIVNKSHILSLKYSGAYNNKIINISLNDYINLSQSKKSELKCWRTKIDFQHKDVILDPYFLGIWLGDGHSNNPYITSEDYEVIDFIKNFSNQYTNQNIFFSQYKNAYKLCRKRGRKKGGEYPSNCIRDILRDLNVLNNKHVPLIYKCNSRTVRLSILAGLLDTDGYYGNGGFDFISKTKQLSEDVVYLSRSLGLAAYMKETKKYCFYKGEKKEGIYYRVSISGDCSIIPTKIKRKQATERKQKKNVLVTGFSVEPIGIGEYYGFTLDGDGLFCLGDFTVTHNTFYIKHLAGLVKRRFIFIPTGMVDSIVHPSLIKVLMDNPNSILVLEDAEKAVISREHDESNSSLVSAILNLSDGILSSLLNTSLIVTFNTERQKIDSAILRKGRLFAEHKFDKLSIEESKKLAKHLNKNVNITEPMSLAEIYNDSDDNFHTEEKNRKIGFQVI